MVKKVKKPTKNLPISPQNTLDTSQVRNSPSSSPPHLLMLQNSLSGLPQFDPTQIWPRTTQNATKTNWNTVKSVFIVDAKDLLKPSSIKIKGASAKWIHEALEHALA
ncbi:hypothetical protein C0995_012890, partial [Termitomyces sp. Mi166